jgi:hypothetical protein
MTLKWYGAKAKDAERKGAARGLMLGAEHVLEEANRIVPIEEGTLARSGVASVEGGSSRVEVGGPDGGPFSLVRKGGTTGDVPKAAVTYDTPYAVRQHEELDYHHDAGRQAKYLETPINDSGVKRKVEELIAREIKRQLGS